MPKPSLEATRWATDETNNTSPSSGQRDTGWTPGQDGVSDYINALAKAYYDWFVYLDAGTWDDDLHVTGDATVDGATTLGGDATVGGNLTLDGDATVGGNVTVAGDVVGPVNVTGTVEADQLYFRSTQTRQLDIHGTAYGSFPVRNSGDAQSTAALQVHDVLIDLPLGAQIWGYSLRVKGNGTDNLTHKLVRIHTGGEIDVGAVTMTAPTATWQVVNNNFAPVTVAAGERYVIRVTAGGDGQRVGWPTCDWTREAP